jgi:two-component sensor histidine kinase
MSEIKRKESIFSRIFNPPKTIFEDYFDQARYILSFRICLFLIFSLGLLTIILALFYGPIYAIVTFTGFIGVVISYILIQKTGDHRRFVLSFNLFGAFLCQLTLYMIEDQPHISDGLWMIISILFAFNTIDKRWATFITLLHTISFSLFFYFFYNDQIHLIKYLNHGQIVATSVNVLICFFIIFYLCWQNIKTNNYAQKQLKQTNQSLQGQYDIINKQNIEKTVLLKEIHHRVKNNLQVIISLLRLQSRELENEEAISKFKDTTGRVLTMSLIHEKMYQSEELSKINLEEYFNSLITDILDSYEINFKVEKEINCKIENLDMRSIVPIALIFNELFSNSLKHAFKNIESPSITLHFIQIDDSKFELMYSDNGSWIQPVKNDTFGLELIEVLTDQIDGELNFTHEPHTKYSIQFENEKFN